MVLFRKGRSHLEARGFASHGERPAPQKEQDKRPKDLIEDEPAGAL